MDEADSREEVIAISGPDLDVWREFVSRHAGGGVLDGRVLDVLPFGAFVELADGIHGLLPQSEWAAPPESGSRIQVRILAIDVEKRRVSVAPA